MARAPRLYPRRSLRAESPPVRSDQDFASLRRRFGFRSISLGSWVRPHERDRAAAAFHGAFGDLMQVLNGPETLISLRGSLSLCYGTGGRPGVAAHYSPASRSLALAKRAGAGSLAHEWFHALDHYLADRLFQDAPTGMFASRAWLQDATPVVHPLNDRLLACLRAIFLTPDAMHPSPLVRAATRTDRTLGQYYFSLPEELCARAFEAFVQDAARGSSFLVRGTRATAEAAAGLYPQGRQREHINAAFAHYFHGLGQALQRAAAASTTP